MALRSHEMRDHGVDARVPRECSSNTPGPTSLGYACASNAASSPVPDRELSSGMTLEDVKIMLGHSTIVLTSNTYGHVLDERQRQVAGAMDAVLGW